MGIFAWIVLGLIAGYVTNRFVGSKDTQSIVTACMIGAGGALLGGLVAVMFNAGSVGVFFGITAWIAAVFGSVVLLLLYSKFTPRAHARY